MSKKKLSYKSAGVDIDKTDKMVKKIKTMCATTTRKEVLGGIGGFGGCFEIPKGYKQPVLVSGTDGVGTKLLISEERKEYSTIGIDLVAMSVNDVIVCGAEPLFFLDYYSSGKIDKAQFFDVLKGIVKGCKQSGCSLVGGEMAEMPDCYPKGKYDLAGFCVGVVEKKEIIDGSRVRKGDVLIGIPSSGLHSNGYSLARKAFSKKELRSEWGKKLLVPTKIYVSAVKALKKNVDLRGISHITGGGLYDNIPRVLPANVGVVIDKESWTRPVIFDEIQKRGNVDEVEMYRTFNMGIGLVVIVPARDVENSLRVLAVEKYAGVVIGEVVSADRSVIIQ